MLNPTWLNTFITLIETGHFTKTAEKLFMTQPGVTQHVHKLEQACGHELLKRDKKSFTLTEQGRLVYDYGKKRVKEEQQLLEQLSFDPPYRGVCSLASSGSVALLLYPKLLELQVNFPELVIKLSAAPTKRILSDIQHDLIDQGIVTTIPDRSLFDSRELGKEELCIVVPKHTNIGMDKAQLLQTLGLISHPDAEHYLSLYITQSDDLELQKLDIQTLPITGEINQIGQILYPVAKGLGFTVLPKSVIDSFQEQTLLTVLKPNKAVIETLYLVNKKNRVLPARYDTLNHLIAAQWEIQQ